jgi:uncharacterized protein
MLPATATFAFDKKSARTFDADGRMRVRGCVISVGEINPYRGAEIPGARALGLDTNMVYDLYRDPVELERAADSFNGLPLMIKHVAQTADEPRKEYIGGSVFNARYDRATNNLLADLLVMDAKAIEYIESGALADLSSGYRYKPDMTPGEYGGRKYHGVMRAIEGNHVALVEDGRATGAHVADSALSSTNGANTVDPNENTAPPVAAPAGSGAELAQALMMLTSKLEAIEGRLTAVEGGKVETPQQAAEEGIPASVNTSTANDSDSSDDDEDDKDKPAMDANAIKALVDAAVKTERDRAAGVADAKRATRAVLGEMIALDNEGDIYREALKQRGVDVSAIAAGHEKTAWQAIQSVATARPVLAQDSASGSKPAFDTSRIRNLGR